MAFFALLWKARTIEKHRLNYEKEKINSIMVGNTEMEKTLGQKWRHYKYDARKRISNTFRKWYPEGSGVSNFLLYLRTEKTLPYLFLKSVLGFLGGIILTYLCFLFFVFQLSLSVMNATIMSSTIGVLLTFGLAFSFRIRCLVFLLIPQLFSRVGRYTLTCYALVLILTGPATNTLKNSEVLTESMACSQEQIKLHVRQMNDAYKNPYNVVKEPLAMMMKRFQCIASAIKKVVVRFNRLVLSIVGSIHSGFAWLQSICDISNTKLGTPYQRCLNMLERGEEECRKSLDLDFSWVCKAANIGKVACVAVKPYHSFCHTIEFMDDAIVATIKKKLVNFSAQMSYMFQVKLHVQHSRSLLNYSSSASQVAAGIVTEIRHKADPLLTWLSWSSCVTSLFLVLIIFRAKNYQNMYETRSRYDNHYITKELRELDLRRQRQGRRTILPLNRRERAKYITTTSFRLVSSEIVNMNRSVVFMLITTFKLLIHMIADYSLYWVLITIRYHGRLQSNITPGVPQTGVRVTGDGFIARLFRSIVETLNLPLREVTPSPIPCLPNPHPPDLRRYTQIGILIFLLWFFALFEPYGLRLRHLIMGHYRPERARDRALWLFQYILRTRAGFMKFARRKLHRQYKYYSDSQMTFREWLNKHIPCKCIKFIFGIGQPEPHCLLCGIQNFPNDLDTELIRCKTPKCPGTYCRSCFADIGELCTICLSPADYGDFSDVSLEKGSSDESSDSENESLYGGTKMVNVGGSFKWMKLPEDDDSCSSKAKLENFTKTSEQLSTDKAEQETILHTNNSFNYKDLNNDLNRISKVHTCVNTNRYGIELSSNNLCPFKMLGNHCIYFQNQGMTDWAKKKKKALEHSYYNDMFLQIVKITTERFLRPQDRAKVMKVLVELFPVLISGDVNNFCRQNGNSKSKNRTSTGSVSKNETKDVPDRKNNLKENLRSNEEIIESNDINGSNYKISKQKIGSFQTFMSRNWNNVKYTLIPCVYYYEANPSINVTKNHKRRKKRRSYNSITIKTNNTEKDSKRNDRIAAFLADLDWTKQDCNTGNEGWTFINTEGLVAIEIKNNVREDTMVYGYNSECNVSKVSICQKDLLQTSVEDIKKVVSAAEIITTGSLPNSRQNFRGRLMDVLVRNKLLSLLCSSSTSQESISGCEKAALDIGDGSNDTILKKTEQLKHSLLSLVPLPWYKLKSHVKNKVGNKEAGVCQNIDHQTRSKDSETEATLIDSKKNTIENSSIFWPPQDTSMDQDILSDEIEKRFKSSLIVQQDFSSLCMLSSTHISRSVQRVNVLGVEKSVAAEVTTREVGCLQTNLIEDSAFQFDWKGIGSQTPCTCNAAVGSAHKTCTCATQYISMSKDDVMLRIQSCKSPRNKHVTPSGVTNVHRQDSLDLMLRDLSSNTSSSKSNETKTDTTVCSLATMEYREMTGRRHRKTKIITKQNQSTCTEKRRCQDASTMTHWAPRRDMKRVRENGNKMHGDGKRDKKCGKKKFKTCAVGTEGKFVSFRSFAQIIPPGTSWDVLSPLRYLLESQRYYNELFANKWTNQVYSVTQTAKRRNKRKKSWSLIGSRRKCGGIGARNCHEK